ncbi:hypothetical protein [Clostridium tyrobutyricum]|uniref:hypothetical protein n=1 Tax=Clostridium tyrobutyricum TaxID=1519 RepID=UPI001C38184E|nr:hypothetical protein [Clostridium tyrobutyricum]MBV4416555.1 hypothetical protein [Clostridium tyrobutyricum]
MENKLNVEHYNCIDKINVIQNYIEKAWENFVLCEFDSGMKYFAKIMIGLDEIITYIDRINNELKPNISFNYILSVLQKVEQCITNKDYVYSADLLKYEISPILESWKKSLM